MPRQSRGSVTGLVLAAGGSKRLGQPKQLLPFGSGTLVEHVLGVARRAELDQVLCVLGPSAISVRDRLELAGVEVVECRDFGEGCSSSIAAALSAVHRRCEVLVLMLGDQPGISAETISKLLAGRGDAPLAACAYADGRGHPLAFARSMFGALAALHGDRGVWRLLERHGDDVVDLPVAGPTPRDVDTWEDYQAVLAEATVS